MPRPSTNHDILVIGASTGGVDAIRGLMAELPAELAAAVFVVIHIDPVHETHLAQLLARPGGMPARVAQDGDTIRPGHILVAPADRHLLVRAGRVEVNHGPRENSHRPAVDALFRTAAAAYGPRVIGVVLTGHRDCGTAGLLSIKARGGVAVVQDPAEAVAPQMPSSAIKHVDVDHVARLADLPALLVHLVNSDAPPWPSVLRPEIEEMEGAKAGDPNVELVCPSCQGKLTVGGTEGFPMFRCHVGHVFTLQSLTAEQADEVERALWASARALEEGASLSARVAGSMTGSMRERLLEKEQTQRDQADVIRALILGGASLSPADAARVATSRLASSPANDASLVDREHPAHSRAAVLGDLRPRRRPNGAVKPRTKLRRAR